MPGERLQFFYFEPFDDRWVRFDRYPRWLARQVLRRNRLSGYRQVVRQLQCGLERAGIPCRVNWYKNADKHPDEPIGVLGNNRLLDVWRWKNPAVVGPCMLDHPKDRIGLFECVNAKIYLVPSGWVRDMFAPYFGDRVLVWPIGIDLELWRDFSNERKTIDFLIYEKFLWDRADKLRTFLVPILDELQIRGLSSSVLHCGTYTHSEYRARLRESKRMIFLCEHETQGQAYQQALACNVPILAWDQGIWCDPKAKQYECRPVSASSVPYFSVDCGLKFRNLAEFAIKLDEFIEGRFAPRTYISRQLNLVESARRYAEIVRSCGAVRT